MRLLPVLLMMLVQSALLAGESYLPRFEREDKVGDRIATEVTCRMQSGQKVTVGGKVKSEVNYDATLTMAAEVEIVAVSAGKVRTSIKAKIGKVDCVKDGAAATPFAPGDIV